MKIIPTVLSVDYGTKRIGLAISRGILTEPLKIIENNEISKVTEEIRAICNEEGVEKIIVGLSEAEMAEITKKFIVQLKQKIDLKIETVDETLSSQEVQTKIKEAGIRLKDNKRIDHYAAAVILEKWMEDNQYTLSSIQNNKDNQKNNCSEDNPNINPCANCSMANRCNR